MEALSAGILSSHRYPQPKFELPSHPARYAASVVLPGVLPTPARSPPIVVQKKLRPQMDERLSLGGNFFTADPKQAHAQFVKLSLDDYGMVKNKLAVLYARDKCYLEDARKLFDMITERSVTLYATLIRSYCRSQMWADALAVLGLMLGDGLLPDKYLVPTLLRVCAGCEATGTGKMLHGYVIREKLDSDVVVGNSLIDMYANCDDLGSARRVFDGMTKRDVVSWTALVAAYADAGLLDEAIEIFESMHMTGVKLDSISWNALISGLARSGRIGKALLLMSEMRESGLEPGVSSWNGILTGCVQNGLFDDAFNIFNRMLLSHSPNAVTMVIVLQACAGLKELKLGKEIHAYAIKQDFLTNIFVCGSLIAMHSKCGKGDYAQRLFVKIENKNSALWNEMISAYANEGKMELALQLFSRMQVDGLQPDLITYNTLLAGYARNGQIDEAYELLNKMYQINLKPNVVSFNALISGFQQFGLNNEALKLFKLIQLPIEIVESYSGTDKKIPLELLNISVKPNVVTIISALSACIDLHLKRGGKEIHGYAIRNLLDPNVIVSSVLVDMYMKCHDVNSATKTFHRLSDKNTVSWNILISGYNNNGDPETALQLYVRMLNEGFVPSSVTLLILLSACSNIEDWRIGRELHGHIAKYGYYMSTVSLASALIKMYAKCGCILEARLIFNQVGEKDVGIWNSMISSYAMHGMGEEVISLFEQMEASGIKPDHITFTGLLSACIREDMVERGWGYFNSMEADYGINPTLEHCTCVVGFLGSAGLLGEALDFVRRMPCEPDPCVWATLLRACRIHSNVEIGETAAKALFELEPFNASNYIVLANIYSTNGMWNSAKDIKAKMMARGLEITRARSQVVVDNVNYTFEAGDCSNPDFDKILEMWAKFSREMEEIGHVPDQTVLGDAEDMDPLSCSHTEKLAICFGILSSDAQRPLRISKNARMCFDCHTSAKFISKIEEREILVRDSCFYHHFKDGICSCRDRW